jgi:tRNA A37 threonylcarbamoyladenosine dehydratase
MSDRDGTVDEGRRYGGIQRLYGADGLARLRAARVAVAGIGGVGSWVVEALARSGVGHLRLIDLDHVAESNMNRQIHALESSLGKAKVVAMAERVADIDPRTTVECVDDFVTEDNLATVLDTGLDYVVDAVDDVRAKAAMVAWCREQGVAVITLGAAGGQVDPTRITVDDLARTTQDPLLAKLRSRLRRDYGFPRGQGKRFRVDAVYSTEPLQYPEAACEADVGPQGLSCAGFGSSMAVTATFGLVAASRVIAAVAAGKG